MSWRQEHRVAKGRLGVGVMAADAPHLAEPSVACDKAACQPRLIGRLCLLSICERTR
jgi:hypothetical protein